MKQPRGLRGSWERQRQPDIRMGPGDAEEFTKLQVVVHLQPPRLETPPSKGQSRCQPPITCRLSWPARPRCHAGEVASPANRDRCSTSGAHVRHPDVIRRWSCILSERCVNLTYTVCNNVYFLCGFNVCVACPISINMKDVWVVFPYTFRSARFMHIEATLRD